MVLILDGNSEIGPQVTLVNHYACSRHLFLSTTLNHLKYLYATCSGLPYKISNMFDRDSVADPTFADPDSISLVC